MTDIFRAPDERFAALPDFNDQPRYAEIDGLRIAYIDEGAGAPVWFMHGEPTWSFLWRHVMGPVRDAGRRTIAPDLPGFGRSDKPTDINWYTYDRHVAVMDALLTDVLDLRDATIVVHDWGGPIGLRLAAEHPDRIARIVILDTGLFTGHQRMTDAWIAFGTSLPAPRTCRSACSSGAPARAAWTTPSSPRTRRRSRCPSPRPAPARSR